MAERKNITRGLRFTITAGYTIVFTLLLIAVSIFFRQRLASNLEDDERDTLNTSWTLVKGNLRIFQNETEPSGYKPEWFFDPADAEENNAMARVRSVILITDADGKVLEESRSYDALGKDNLSQIKAVLNSNQVHWIERTSPNHKTYLVRQSWVFDQDHKARFFVALGTPLTESQNLLRQFTLAIVGLVPLIFLTGILTGWFFAGRALTPVLEIAQAAQRITGSKLSLRIPSRGAGDELDYLIETFNRMIERLEINFNQVRQFSTDVSHELRTPITIIRGQLEVALFTAETVEEYREAIVNSLADIERLSQIVRALLLLSQAETGQVVLQKQSLDLAALAREIVDQFQIPAEGANLTLDFRANCEHCPGEFDRVQVERMLSNLLSNAIKFTPPGGRVGVILNRDGDEAELRVEDTGQGIPAEHLPHIFDRFYRVRGPSEAASPEKGLGLGLSFVAWIARAHGGSIDVQSDPGKGTTFRIRMPLSGSQAIPSPQEQNGEVMKTV
ncbi:MAG: heavy metal sensor histidine kinase [Acidobacteriota bacterium]|nr:heavy metal sensor histidine kinase [Acidobacteriota bacterium]